MKSDDKLMKEISKRHNHYLAVCKKYSERIKAITKRFKKETGVCVRSKFDQVTKTRFYTCSKGLLIDLGSTYHSNIKNVWNRWLLRWNKRPKRCYYQRPQKIRVSWL